MPKSKKAPKTSPKAKTAAPSAGGIVLKKAFPSLDAEGLKLVRRHLRKALRAKEGFNFHKIGSRWLFPTARDVAAAKKAVQPYLQ